MKYKINSKAEKSIPHKKEILVFGKLRKTGFVRNQSGIKAKIKKKLFSVVKEENISPWILRDTETLIAAQKLPSLRFFFFFK